MSSSTGSGNGAQPPIDEALNSLPPYTNMTIKLGVLALGLLVAFILLNIGRGVYTNLLWFSSLDLRSVYTTILFTRIWLFLAGSLVMAGLMAATFWFAFRSSWGPRS